MALIKGSTIKYVTKKEIGKDGFNKPIYEEKTEEIENVLISPGSSDDIVSSQDLDGKKAVYTLGIPKGDVHEWENAEVEFFGKRWKTYGIPLECDPANVPLDWNKKVMVERYG